MVQNVIILWWTLSTTHSSSKYKCFKGTVNTSSRHAFMNTPLWVSALINEPLGYFLKICLNVTASSIPTEEQRKEYRNLCRYDLSCRELGELIASLGLSLMMGWRWLGPLETMLTHLILTATSIHYIDMKKHERTLWKGMEIQYNHLIQTDTFLTFPWAQMIFHIDI